ncbi:MAG TPA: crossover junction endodeoxyribonuclease RuvC [Candidatus Babeliales bacterium]|nr:crossover junction endodeoxyribonuclease RuvC [Candidatus Babeliales bacterium]
MVILGVDPGLHYCGYAIIQKEGNKATLLNYGYLSLSPSKTVASRLSEIHSFFGDSISKYNITHISFETPFLGKNAQNFLKLGYVRGILYLLAHNHGLIITEFSPREIKQSLTGYGAAGKDQVARVILALFPRMEKPKKEDVTDALAVTLCGLWKHSKSQNC